MAENGRVYLCIDLKSFYASVECVDRGLDPLTTNLVVADVTRTEKTICLAVSPSLKACGIPGRARLFEVVQKLREINVRRQQCAPGRRFSGESTDAAALKADPSLSAAYIAAPPRMAHYLQCSARIYDLYLRYFAPEDIHVYSIDEVFIDLTGYLSTYGLSARQLAQKLMREVFSATGITATAGLGTNLYLCKVAMDIVAKHAVPDAAGARIAELDERSYREQLWEHRPLTDFWRVGRGIARRLEANGIFTMGDVARVSMGRPSDAQNEELLYRLFGVNAELLIDHAWGCEPCTLREIKAYRPAVSSLSTGQVLSCPYTFEKARLVVREMAESLALELVEKQLETDQVVLTVGYDVENLKDPARRSAWHGEVVTDGYGRSVPRHAQGTAGLGRATSSSRRIVQAALAVFDEKADARLLVRRLTLAAGRLAPAGTSSAEPECEQLDLFNDYAELTRRRAEEEAELKRENRLQQAMLSIKKKYGKNAVLKGMDLEEGATAAERNNQIGGHKA